MEVLKGKLEGSVHVVERNRIGAQELAEDFDRELEDLRE